MGIRKRLIDIDISPPRKLARKSGDKLTWENFIDAHLRIEKQAEQPGEWADEPKKSDGGAK